MKHNKLDHCYVLYLCMRHGGEYDTNKMRGNNIELVVTGGTMWLSLTHHGALLTGVTLSIPHTPVLTV